MNEVTSEQILARIREAAALFLWRLGAVKVNLKKPFKLASGNYSPIYFNCRQVISDPSFMHLFTTSASLICRSRELIVGMVAGGETAGIPFAAYVAQGLSRPLLYVRKARKGHGLSNLVEGGNPDGTTVLLVEDLITDGGSKLHFIETLRTAGAVVSDVLVLFDRKQGGEIVLGEHGTRLHAVADIDVVLDVARHNTIITSDLYDSLVRYLDNPGEWHQEMGLEFVLT